MMDVVHVLGQTPMARKEDFNHDKIPLNFNDFNNNYGASNNWSIFYFIALLLLVISSCAGLYNCLMIQKIDKMYKIQHKLTKESNQESENLQLIN